MRGVIAVLAVAAGVSAQDRPADWKGDLVVGKKWADEITFGAWVNDKYERYPFKGIYPITVRQDKDGWLRVFDGHREAWVKKDEFVLSKDAPAYFTDRIRTNPKDTFAWFWRGVGWLDRGEFDNAVKDLTECIRLDPRDAFAFNSRGNAWSGKGDKDQAVRDYDEAIRLRPGYAAAFNNRGTCWFTKNELERAVADYTEAIRLDPRYRSAYENRGRARAEKGDIRLAADDYGKAIELDPKNVEGFEGRADVFYRLTEFDRAVIDYDAALRLDPKHEWAAFGRAATLFAAGRPGTADGCRRVVEQGGQLAPYAVILGRLAARRDKDDAAAKWFLSAADKLKAEWPEPVVRFLRGDLDEPGLLKLATDKGKETEARAYLGLDHLLRGNRDAARAHFRWVKDNGEKARVPYTLAVVELARLEKGDAPKE